MNQLGLAGGIVVVVGLLAGLALGNAGDATASRDPRAERKVTLAVDGMDCAACPITVRTSLERLDGVKVAGVDVASGTMDVVVSSGSVTDDQLLNAVTNAGYHATIGGTSSPIPDAGSDRAAKPGARLSRLSADLEPLRAAFNETRGKQRILAVVSPKCPACVRGVDAIQASILGQADADVRVLLVWSPMLARDNERTARSAAAKVTDPRVRQFLDLERHAGSALRRELFPDARAAMLETLPSDHYYRPYAEASDAGKPEWDIYLSFPAEALWTDRIPQPDRWIRQTAMFPGDNGQLTSLLWLDDYAATPVEADLVQAMARLLR